MKAEPTWFDFDSEAGAKLRKRAYRAMLKLKRLGMRCGAGSLALLIAGLMLAIAVDSAPLEYVMAIATLVGAPLIFLVAALRYGREALNDFIRYVIDLRGASASKHRDAVAILRDQERVGTPVILYLRASAGERIDRPLTLLRDMISGVLRRRGLLIPEDLLPAVVIEWIANQAPGFPNHLTPKVVMLRNTRYVSVSEVDDTPTLSISDHQWREAVAYLIDSCTAVCASTSVYSAAFSDELELIYNKKLASKSILLDFGQPPNELRDSFLNLTKAGAVIIHHRYGRGRKDADNAAREVADAVRRIADGSSSPSRVSNDFDKPRETCPASEMALLAFHGKGPEVSRRHVHDLAGVRRPRLVGDPREGNREHCSVCRRARWDRGTFRAPGGPLPGSGSVPKPVLTVLRVDPG